MEMDNQLFEATKQILWYQFDTPKKDDIINIAKDCYNEIKDNIVSIAALVTVLNHKSWYYYDSHNSELSRLYSDLYYEYNDKAWDWLDKNGTEEEKHWYFKTMD